MPITHEEARKLIQFQADEALKSQEKFVLSAHLKECSECRFYEEDIKQVENILLPVMKRHWDRKPVPLSTRTLTEKTRSQIQPGIIVATRSAAIAVVFMAFIFSVWQFTLSGNKTANPAPIVVLPVPTPSVQSTSTKITFQNCEQMPYNIQENDTLASIAHQFGVSKEEIMALNNMQTEIIYTSMELMIPICNSTPTSTAEGPTALTTTYTPVLDLITSTPGG